MAVRYFSSGSFGYTTAVNMNLGYVENESGVSGDYLSTGAYELVVAMETVPAKLVMQPLVNSDGVKARG